MWDELMICSREGRGQSSFNGTSPKSEETHLKHPVLLRRSVGPATRRDWDLLYRVAHTVKVVLRRRVRVERHRYRVLLDDGVALSELANRRVDSDREQVLVVGGENTWRDNCSVRRGLAWKDGARREDARRSRLEVEVGGLVEL